MQGFTAREQKDEIEKYGLLLSLKKSSAQDSPPSLLAPLTLSLDKTRRN